MIRTPLAFLIAPLWVPTIVGIVVAILIAPNGGQTDLIKLAVVASAIIAHGGTLFLGLPLFLILRAGGHRKFWVGPILGFVAGTFAGVLLFSLYGLLFGLSFADFTTALSDLPMRSATPFVFTGCLGSIVGSTFWAIARPDRLRAVAPSSAAATEGALSSWRRRGGCRREPFKVCRQTGLEEYRHVRRCAEIFKE